MRNKKNALRYTLETHEPDILVVTEHWITQNEIDLLTIEGYRLVNHFSRAKAMHGGVAIFLSDAVDLNCSQIMAIDKLGIESVIELG